MIKNQRLPFWHTANTAHPMPTAITVNHSGMGAEVQVGFFVGVVMTARVVATVVIVVTGMVVAGVVIWVVGVAVGDGVTISAVKVIFTGPETVTPTRSP